jgi:signal transduction histidine kinase
MLIAILIILIVSQVIIWKECMVLNDNQHKLAEGLQELLKRTKKC